MTPGGLISGIITECGVILPEEGGEYGIKAWLEAQLAVEAGVQ